LAPPISKRKIHAGAKEQLLFYKKRNESLVMYDMLPRKIKETLRAA
jgi:hypothetical protein